MLPLPWPWSRRSTAATAYQKVEGHDDASNGRLDIHLMQARLDSLRRWLCMLAALLVACLSTIAFILSHQHDMPHRGPAPQLQTKAVTFEKSELYSGSSSHEANEAWQSLMPQGQGFVLVEQPEDFGLPEGMPVTNRTGQLYDVSAFHQLHCLINIRQYLVAMNYAIDIGRAKEVKPKMFDSKEVHMYHCFDYLRQAIMCAADSTLEWPRTEASGQRFAVDGWGVTHRCLDWIALVQYTEANTWPRVI